MPHARDGSGPPAIKNHTHSSIITTEPRSLRPAPQHRPQSSLSDIAIGQNHNLLVKMSTERTVIEEHHIHGFLGYFTVAASLLTIGSTLGLLIEQYERAGRSLSTRQGVHRGRLVQIFLGLALACFVVVTTLKYASPVARAEVGETLAGGHAGSTANGFETRSTEDGYAGVTEQKPAAMR